MLSVSNEMQLAKTNKLITTFFDKKEVCMKLNMKTNDEPGYLITFCGLDGSGKTTQIALLSNYLQGRGLAPIVTKQPTEMVRKSKVFRTYMDNPCHDDFDYRALSLLCAADRIQHTNKEIVPHLASGNIVISDRYFYSCLANLRARGYTEDTWIYEIAHSITKPDISFFIDVDVDTAVSRVRSREYERDRYIDIELQYRLREEYLQIARENEGIILDSRQSIQEMFQIVKSSILYV